MNVDLATDLIVDRIIVLGLCVKCVVTGLWSGSLISNVLFDIISVISIPLSLSVSLFWNIMINENS